MSYPRNAASPERVSIGAVVQISDGAVQTSGVAVKVIPFGAAEASGTGTVAYSADGVVLYTPVQGETNYTSFVLVASKAGCIPASTTVVTSAASVAGTVTLAASQPSYAPLTTLGSNAPAGWINAAAVAANTITAAAFASNAITEPKIAPNAITSAKFAGGTTLPRVTLVDTVTTYTGNTPQTGDSFARIGLNGAGLTAVDDTVLAATDAILTAVNTRLATASYTAPPSVGAIADAVWDEARTGHTTSNTFGFFLDAAISGISAGSGATAQQVWEYTTRGLTEAVELDSGAVTAVAAPILAVLQGVEVIHVPSPNVLGNLVLTQSDNYDGIANPRAQWNVTTDYTDGWSVTLTIRDASDAVIYTTSGTVVSATVIAVTIAAPAGLTMQGCPGQWQGKFDVQLAKAGSKKTIALGVCYINEDQTR